MLQLETRTGSPRSFTISAVLHAIALALLLTIHFAPAVIKTENWHVTLLAPSHDVPHPVKIAPPKPRLFRAAIPAPQRVETRVALEAPPVLELRHAPAPALELPKIAAPPPPMKTDNLAAAAPAPPPPVPAKVVLQPAGFSAAQTHNTMPATNRVASTGAFEGAEPARVASQPATLHASGFAENAAAPSPAPKKSIVAASFGDAEIGRPETKRKFAPAASATAVEIQFKPKPAYTAEAQQLKIEGEVLLEIVFEASGKARVLRVIRGLGHGLDENAAEAARAIRFKPAISAGTPVDSTAVVHIVFQLAY